MPVVIWRDIFALVDQGCTRASDYPIFESMVREQAENYSHGLGCLVIIPSTARPLPDDVRRAINEVLTRLAPSLRCLCWLVEGSGFRAAAVRATLAGLRILQRPPYPTLVASELDKAVDWMFPHLGKNGARLSGVPSAVDAITRGRQSLRPTAS